MNRRRFLGTGALLFSGGCLQARPGTTPSTSSPSGRSTTKSNDNCQGGFEVEARPFTASEFTVQLSDDERELDMQGIADGEKVTAGSIGGPAWEYQLQVDTEIAVEVLKETSRFADIDFQSISADRVNT